MNRKEEIEKGCGKNYGEDDEMYCLKESEESQFYKLCPTCQARLDERIRAEQDFLRLIDEIKKKYDADFEATDLDTGYRTDMMFEELKSTIQKEKTNG